MLRLHKHRQPPKSGTKIDFTFSSFKALQVPKGWDKLVVSVVSVETGKTVSKTSKAVVRNGSCQWNETLSESIRVPDDDSYKETDDCLFKFIVSMGSARSGILGEVTLNMIDYTSTSASVPLTLTLKKCNHGTSLQVKIQCTTPRTKSRDDDSKEKNPNLEKSNGNFREMDTKSDGSGSDSTVAKSFKSSSAKDFHLISPPGEPGSRETSFSMSESHQSYDSAGGSIEEENISLGDSSGEVRSFIRREDSISSGNSVSHSSYPTDNHLKQSFSSQIMGSGNHSEKSRQEIPASSLTITTSSKNLLEAAEDTIEELRAEAKMWERNARKLMLDLDILKVEFSDQSKIQATLNVELSAAFAERDNLKKEVEQLKLSLDNSMLRQPSSEDLVSRDEGLPHPQKELKDELKFLKESNVNLAAQLKRSHESNIELVSVLHELEDTIERQKIEIDNLLAVQSKFSDMEKTIEANMEENRKLTLEVQQLQESEKNLIIKVQLLEQALEEKNQETKKGRNLNNENFWDIETEYKTKLLDKEEEIDNLKAKLSESLDVAHSAKVGSTNDSDVNLIRELEVLKEKVKELEMDCNELTEENLELLFKLKESKNDLNRRDTSFDFPHSERSTNSLTSFEFQLSANYGEEKLEKKGLKESRKDDNNSIQVGQSLEIELEAKLAEMDKELAEKRSGMEKLQVKLLSKEEEILVLRKCQSELEAKVADVQKEKIRLQEHVEVRRDITSKHLNDLQHDLVVITSSVDSHASANKTLERMSSELETGNRELELHVSELEGENVRLSVLVASLEAQLRYLTGEQQSSQLELENSKSHAMTLQVEINTFQIEMASERVDQKEKLHKMQIQLSESQEECEYLRRASSKLQSTVESLIEECNSFQKSNGELRNQKLELHDRCSHLEAKLEESHKSFTDCTRKVDELEQYLSSVLEEVASKEKSLTSEIDALLDENLRHNEKFNQEQSLLNQMYMDKVIEVENLQQEVEVLVKKLSERERIASDSVQELSRLCADNAKLESNFQDIQSKSKQTENELNIKLIEYELKLKGLSSELVASNHNQELLMADHEKLSKLLENYRSGEGKFKTIVNDLELRLTVSEYERQQLVEASSNLKVQLQKLTHVEGELVAFKNELDATKSEKEKLEASVNAISKECKHLKAERNELIEEISTLKNAVSELEDCRSDKLALEEKLAQMEGDLVEIDALRIQDAEQKKELTQIRRETRQYQEERDECQRKSQALEEELKLLKEEKQNQREHSGRKATNISKINTKVNPVHETAKFPKNEMAKSGNQRRDNRRNGVVQEVKKDSYRSQSQRENGSGCTIPNGSPHDNGVDPGSKVQLLEDQLAKALEENYKHKVQLDRLLSEGQNGHADALRKSTPEGEVVSKEKFEHTKSSLEAELRDIRERYLDMSLKYAEVEAQREELVMKLKTAKSGKRWFSMNS
ncbi:RPG related protein [Parasponia andersonii]|uniref:RPG related protein n=1 Tax=Parasponia andersonii TaxID=3476 RepID=A0A2P5C573_PARAD|nr:RPG related protein [Parasponia andersonii]